MSLVVGIIFKEDSKTYYFPSGPFHLKPRVTVIVKTERGLQFGKVVTTVSSSDKVPMVDHTQKIVRIASKKDYQEHRKNLKDAKAAVQDAKRLAVKHGLDMQMIDADFTFDRNQLLIRFMADNRVDFRELVKELASIYHTRIELRQIGVRDKARDAGGIGPCGRLLCCGTFLNDFDSVSINMAKNQNIALNPAKINGCCGRLLCCLKYEDDTYRDCRKCLPNVGSIVQTSCGSGKVVSVNVLKMTYCVDVVGNGIIEESVCHGSK